MGRLRYEKCGIPNPYTDVFRVLPSTDEHKFLATINGFRTVRIRNQPSFIKPTPGINNKEVLSLLCGPPDWMVVQEGTTSIPILGHLHPQDDVEEIRTSLAIPEGCFTACPYGLRHSKPGTILRT